MSLVERMQFVTVLVHVLLIDQRNLMQCVSLLTMFKCTAHLLRSQWHKTVFKLKQCLRCCSCMLSHIPVKLPTPACTCANLCTTLSSAGVLPGPLLHLSITAALTEH